MAFDTSSGDGQLSDINVTPLVDVMLVLLVIFMVAAPILQQGVELELPQETIAPVQGDGEQLVVSITQAGDVFVGSDNKVSLQDIAPRLEGIMKARSDKSLFIRADRRVPYGKVMAVMARVRKAGISKIGLITEAE